MAHNTEIEATQFDKTFKIGTGCQNLSLPPEKYVSAYSNQKALPLSALSR
jgi:hypothetical protein